MQRARLLSVDVYRGLAILAMVAYHLIWDLNYYGFIAVGIGIDALWFTIQRSILTAFLLLTGAGLWLAHRHGTDWQRFWRRWAVLAAAAIGVSIVTWFQFGEYFSWFGVLHAIALSWLLALPLIRAPLWSQIGVAAIFLFLPLIVSSAAFNTPWLSWLGFFTIIPMTADLVPLFPWFGVVLIGIIGMRLVGDTPAFTWQSRAPGIRFLALLGKWSLLIYLVHQPLLFAAIGPIAQWRNDNQQARFAAFTQQCEASCGVNGEAAFCASYCACALEITVRDNLWSAPPDALTGIAPLCTAMAR